MSAHTIWNFWRSNEKFWIPVTDAQKAVADKTIFAAFYNYSNLYEEDALGQIIYLDQFFRHFQRVLPEGTISEKEIYQNRLKAAGILEAAWPILRKSKDPLEIVWALMPLKHLERWQQLFSALHEIALPLDSGPLSKFYQDSYKKAYTDSFVAANIITDHTAVLGKYQANEICDYYPEGRHGIAGDVAPATALTAALSHLDRASKYCVSLSGGVDSMVMVTLLKHMGYNVNAVHIVYGNRKESEQEYAFIATFCAHLDIPLMVYRIEWLRRQLVEREFYEKMGREIRFMIYREIACPVLLGHISEDVIENIWTNIACAQHLHNLKKMAAKEEQLGVVLIRPFLNQIKDTIYEASRSLSVPYLKNTTPSWSNRGKFREHFHPAIKAQYGAEVDKKIVQFAKAITEQSRILDRILYQPIYKSYNPDTKTIDITGAIEAGLDVMGWSVIFEYICHQILGINKPSFRCLNAFVCRLAQAKKITMNMNGHLQINIKQSDEGRYIMKCISIGSSKI